MPDSPYIDALEKQRQAVDEWAEFLNDPFKAPELKVGLPPDVFRAVINAIAEQRLLNRKGGNGS